MFFFSVYLFQNIVNIALQSSARTRNLKAWFIIKVFLDARVQLLR